MTQHPPCSPTLSSKPEDLDQEISRKLKILDFATLVLSHPSMMQAVREMATKELGTATKRTTSPIDPSMPGTSASSTITHRLHMSTGMPIIDSQKEKAILRREKRKKREQSEKTSRSPKLKLDLQVALALDEIFETLLGETTTAVSKLKME